MQLMTFVKREQIGSKNAVHNTSIPGIMVNGLNPGVSVSFGLNAKRSKCQPIHSLRRSAYPHQPYVN